MAVCDRHGNWEPNISTLCQSEPTGIYTYRTSKSAEFTQMFSQSIGPLPTNTISLNTTIIAVVSLITMLFLASMLFFIVGFFCGRLTVRRKKMPSSSEQTMRPDESVHSAQSPQHSALYEDIVTQPKQQEKLEREGDLELKQNVAYGPLKLQ